MFYNILINKTLPNTEINHCAVPANEGLSDIAYVNGWRILVPALPERLLAPTIIKREGWEWNLYLYDLANSDLSNFLVPTGELPLLVDDVADEEEDGEFDEDAMTASLETEEIE